MGKQGQRAIQEFIFETLEICGKLVAEKFGERQTFQEKSDSSLVTETDLASEKVILDRIDKFFPDDLTLSEEAGLSSAARKPGDSIWIVDPLDGTTNFAHGYPFFSVSIARCEITETGRFRATHGGIGDPLRGQIYTAERGKGSFLNHKRIYTAQKRALKDCFLVTGFYYNRGQALKNDLQRLEEVADNCPTIRRDGSAALDLAYVASGVFDGFWELGLKPWDIAAGALIVEEAGGTALNLHRPADDPTFDIEGQGILCGSPSTVSDLDRLIGVTGT